MGQKFMYMYRTVIQNHVACRASPSPLPTKECFFLAAIYLVTITFGESSCKLLNEETLFCQEITGPSKPEDFVDVMNVTWGAVELCVVVQ
jgi:hypothetical protein